MKTWIIIADDLTGAADCAIAFAKNGVAASVMFNDAAAQTTVVALDVGSRPFPGPKAASMQHQVLERHFRPGLKLYKKIDSLIRGQPAAETAATIKFLRERGHGGFAVLAPAFPALGRVTRNASIFLNDEALEQTAIWHYEHTYANANLVDMLKSADINAYSIPLEIIRQGEKCIVDNIREAMHKGYDAVVCDAETDQDLEQIAQATLPMANDLFWIGTGGLAGPLAHTEKQEETDAFITLPSCPGGILTIVGSLAQASRNGAEHMRSSASVKYIPVPPHIAFSGKKQHLSELADAAVAGLKAGNDVLVEITEVPDPDLSKGGELAGNMAEAFKEAVGVAGGLVITGGETAAAFLSIAGIDGIHLVDEVERGVPAGLTLGSRTIPIVTKAGSFGTELTLTKGLEFVRSVKKKGSF